MTKTLLGLAAAAALGFAALAPSTASAGGYGGYGGYGGSYGGYDGGYYAPYCFVKKIRVYDYYGWHYEYRKICR